MVVEASHEFDVARKEAKEIAGGHQSYQIQCRELMQKQSVTSIANEQSRGGCASPCWWPRTNIVVVVILIRFRSEQFCFSYVIDFVSVENMSVLVLIISF